MPVHVSDVFLNPINNLVVRRNHNSGIRGIQPTLSRSISYGGAQRSACLMSDSARLIHSYHQERSQTRKLLRLAGHVCKEDVAQNNNRPFMCTEDNCNRTYTNRTALRRHIREAYNWVPKPCPQCKRDRLFESSRALNSHKATAHGFYKVPAKSAIAQCRSNNLWKAPRVLAQQLLVVHSIPGDEYRRSLFSTLKSQEGGSDTFSNRPFVGWGWRWGS